MATPYLGYSSTDWARSAATTLADHIRDVEMDWMRNYQLGALLEANDRISFNHGGRGFDWPIQYRIHNIEGNTGETVRNFARRNLFKTAALPYRGYQATDAIFKKERLENRGEAAIVKMWEGFSDRLEKSIKQGIATEWYVDGNATGNEQSWHGFESFLNATQTINSSTGAARTANAADYVTYPNDTYATQSTVLGSFGGDQTSGAVWPAGTADPEFDAWSPVGVNVTCSGFTGTTWAANCLDAMRYLIIHSQRNTSLNGQLTNIFLNRDAYRLAITKCQTEEQIRVTPGEPNAMRSLGFKNVFNFDGIDVSWETAVPVADPAATSRTMYGYGFNYNNIELRCMEDTIFKTETQYDIDTQADKFVVYTLSNIKFEDIRNVGKLTSLA
jgi:hypothetical protein